MKLVSLRLAVLLAGLAVVLFATATPSTADEWNLETKITPDHQIEVPGAVLDANTAYVVALMDSPYERHVVRVYNADRSQMLTQFIAISSERLNPVDKTTFEFMEVPPGHPVPVQTWYYPGRRIGLEFLYPKEDRDRFAAYFREQRTEQVAQLEPPAPPAQPVEPAITEPTPPAVDQQSSIDQTQTEPVDTAQVVEEPKTDNDVVRTKPTEPEPAVQTSESSEREELPRTAGEVELLGLVGALATTLGVGVRMTRR